MNNTFDILIVGGGPIGLACGLEAQKDGLSYLIVEKGTITNSLFNYPLNMTFFSTADRLEIGGYPFPSIHPKPNRSEALEYYRRVSEIGELNIRLFEEVTGISRQGELYLTSTSKSKYQSRYVILATGFYDIPNMLAIPGEDLPKVKHYYYDPHYYYKQKIVVVGANNSSADVALETWRKGAEVTMVVREGELGRIKYWTKPDLENRIAEGSIKAYFHSSLTAVRENEVDIHTPEGKVTIPNDFVMAMTGYQPNFAFLEKVGVKLSDDFYRYPYHNPETMETNLPGLYLAGVVCGGMETHVWFIENSREHAVKIVQNILKK
ncbi:YpdA family putative bacillithiol disulfide reductase [Pontibacter virosus]|uniref:Thioredoxin reductase (NADPH) n=1 Tax=Pontibacter virosus TaxID=1765052 RepID=A0A2U1B2X0_9BACT|nr:YpdA family putative bacillithiol disulfide reductase [Pontibacter virosus]PVY42952.1 thioredoxin reductase (NADPH) [Pontibacter virosus]